MDGGTIWDLRGKNGRYFCDTNSKQLKSVTSREWEQRYIIKLLHLKGLKLQETTTELSSAHRHDAYARLSVNYWLHQIKLGRTDLQTQHVCGPPPLDGVDVEILSLLRESPFSSVRTIAGFLNIPLSTIYSHLVEKIGLKNFLLCWVPHTPAGQLRQKRVKLAGQILQVLEGQQRVGFCDIATGDEA
jgi:hypothetical protein